jgi:hydroxymethylbilane synthase
MLPCVGQAALGIEIRENDPRLERVAAALNDVATQHCVAAERAFLRGLGGGCQMAVGAYAEVTGETLRLRAVSFLGQNPVRGEKTGRAQDALTLGTALAHELHGHA